MAAWEEFKNIEISIEKSKPNRHSLATYATRLGSKILQNAVKDSKLKAKEVRAIAKSIQENYIKDPMTATPGMLCEIDEFWLKRFMLCVMHGDFRLANHQLMKLYHSKIHGKDKRYDIWNSLFTKSRNHFLKVRKGFKGIFFFQ